MVDLSATAEDAAREAIELFYFAYRAFTSAPDDILRQRGLGRVHHRILYFVGRHPSVSISDLLEILAISKQALNAPLRRLTVKGLIGVNSDESDRRYRYLTLTASGRSLETQLTGTQMQHLAKVFALSGKEAATGWKAIMRLVPAQSP